MKKEISMDEALKYQGAMYRVTTVTPLTKGPYMSEYKMNWEELENWLKDYGNFAEYIVEIRIISTGLDEH